MRKVQWIAMGLALAACSQPRPDATENATAPVPAINASAAETPGPAASSTTTPSGDHPCNVQEGKAAAHRLKALGTEPFWAAEVDGRCVTYKTPEDQQGTRVWTKVTEVSGGTVFEGALRGRQFQLTVKPAPGCSDGMSDRTYPQEAVLRVDGETRRGCAEPL